jgi:drug/metabolite transporter (DMT)-like permease
VIYGKQTVSSVSTNLVLTARKAVSLVLSVWWFGNGWNRGLVLGGSLVFAGSVLYSNSSDPEKEGLNANGAKRANGLHRVVKGKAE